MPESEVQAEGHGGTSFGLVRRDEAEPDHDGQQVGVEQTLDQSDPADPGQPEANDEGEAHVAEGDPARVHQVHEEEEREERQAADRRHEQAFRLPHDQGNGDPAGNHGHA